MESNEPKLTQKEISKQLGFSDSPTKRYRDNTILDSPYNTNRDRKNNKKSNFSITRTQTRTMSENTENNKVLKKMKIMIKKVALF